MEIKGFTYGYHARRGDYRSEAGVKSRELLLDTGINWVCLAPAFSQKTFSSTEITFDYARHVTDLDILEAVRHFHSKNVKVCLKPILNSDDGMWRALIDFPDENMRCQDVYWDKWFAAYSAFMLHYAGIAEESGCEMLCIGCEMLGTERKETHWRRLIEEIRAAYTGKLIYNTNHGHEADVKWFDALDFIGTSAYYPVAKQGGASAEEMAQVWEKIAERLGKLSEEMQKKIVFMEIGCRSAEGCATMPWDFTHMHFPWSEEEQANFYHSCLSVFSDKPWFGGVFWWDWSTKIYDDRETAEKDLGFNIHLKKAETVIRQHYASLRELRIKD